jgi:hypothetical protein
MRPFCVAFPVLPGKGEVLKQFAKAATTDKFRELDASEKRLGIPRESWFLQQTPRGDLLLIYFEARDPMKVLQEFGASKDPFDQWFKQMVKESTGVDLGKPPPEPLPEAIGTYGY